MANITINNTTADGIFSLYFNDLVPPTNNEVEHHCPLDGITGVCISTMNGNQGVEIHMEHEDKPFFVTYTTSTDQFQQVDSVNGVAPTSVSDLRNKILALIAQPTNNVMAINNNISRPINSTTYTVSTDYRCRFYYTIKIQCTASIGSASSGLLLFQYSVDNGSNWISLGEVQNSNTVTLAITLNSVTIQTCVLSGEIPAGALCRLVPTTSGTTTITFVRGSEVLY